MNEIVRMHTVGYKYYFKNDAAPYKSIRLTVTVMTSDDDNDECNTNITTKQ